MPKKLNRKNAEVLVGICAVICIGSFALIATLKLAAELGLIS